MHIPGPLSSPLFWGFAGVLGHFEALWVKNGQEGLFTKLTFTPGPTSENCTKTRFFVQFGLFLGILRGFLDDLIPGSSSQFWGFGGCFPRFWAKIGVLRQF